MFGIFRHFVLGLVSIIVSELTSGRFRVLAKHTIDKSLSVIVLFGFASVYSQIKFLYLDLRDLIISM
jgi:hypothetical protein